MIYTKNEIVMEATLYGDLARIQVATDMTYDHYMDMMETAVMENDWAMMEASDDAAKKSIAQMIKSVIEKIKEFIKKQIEMVQRKLALKKLSDIGIKFSEAKINALIKNSPPGKRVKAVDIERVLDLTDKVEKDCEKFFGQVASASEKMNGMPESKFNAAKQKLMEFCTEKIEKFDEDAQKILDLLKDENKIDVPVSKYLKSLIKIDDVAQRLQSLALEVNEVAESLQTGFFEAQSYETKMLFAKVKMNKRAETYPYYSESVIKEKATATIKSICNKVMSFITRLSKTFCRIYGTLCMVAGSILVSASVYSFGTNLHRVKNQAGKSAASAGIGVLTVYAGKKLKAAGSRKTKEKEVKLDEEEVKMDKEEVKLDDDFLNELK